MFDNMGAMKNTRHPADVISWMFRKPPEWLDTLDESLFKRKGHPRMGRKNRGRPGYTYSLEEAMVLADNLLNKGRLNELEYHSIMMNIRAYQESENL